MTMQPTAPPARLPTLTEVIPGGAAGDVSAATPTAVPSTAAALDEDRIVQRVLVELQRQVDLMLEYRLREVLAPALARASSLLLHDTRNELASTLRDIVSRAVQHEIVRHDATDKGA